MWTAAWEDAIVPVQRGEDVANTKIDSVDRCAISRSDLAARFVDRASHRLSNMSVHAYFNLHSSDSTIHIFCLTLALGFTYHFYVHFRKRNTSGMWIFLVFCNVFSLRHGSERNSDYFKFPGNRSEQNYEAPSFFFSSTKWFGTEFRVFFHLLRNGSKRNSLRFPFRKTDGIPKERINIFVCSVFCRTIFFLGKWQP